LILSLVAGLSGSFRIVISTVCGLSLLSNFFGTNGMRGVRPDSRSPLAQVRSRKNSSLHSLDFYIFETGQLSVYLCIYCTVSLSPFVQEPFLITK
jgi:hypothetical protein